MMREPLKKQEKRKLPREKADSGRRSAGEKRDPLHSVGTRRPATPVAPESNGRGSEATKKAAPPASDTTDFLHRPLRSFKFVGDKLADALAKKELRTAKDALRYFPRSYEDFSSLKPIDELEDGEEACFIATPCRLTAVHYGHRKQPFGCVFSDGEGTLRARFFSQPYMRNRLAEGGRFLVHGTVRNSASGPELINPEVERVSSEEDLRKKTGLRPIYPLTQGLKQYMLRRLIAGVVEACDRDFPEFLPRELCRHHKLCAGRFAYQKIHAPASQEELDLALRRLKFEELFLVQYGLRRLHEKKKVSERVRLRWDEAAQKQYERRKEALPFALTSSQEEVMQELIGDLSSGFRMNRLLQGDVGSGKTVIALLAMALTADAGGQAALMVPTAVLAKQHYRTFRRLLPAVPEDELALLTGQLGAKEKRRIYEGLRSGKIRYVLGTHALLSEGVEFADLRLAVTDEQHRFGVRQRLHFHGRDGQEKGEDIHVLVMSATPIPRTLALILYGDLSVSWVRERPRGKARVQTFTARTEEHDRRIYSLVKRQINAGGAAFYICPSIEKGEKDLHSVEESYRELSALYSDFRVGLLHGAMKEKDKQRVMEDFAEGRLDILVATTVVEVGIDVPRANMMVILDAERYGMAQLHQLRGRVGRGGLESYCILRTKVSKDEEASRRLRELCLHEDGYILANKDLELRGPGQFFGTKQHGLPDFRIANLYTDAELLAEVTEAVDFILAGKQELRPEEKQKLEAGLCFYFDEGDWAQSI